MCAPTHAHHGVSVCPFKSFSDREREREKKKLNKSILGGDSSWDWLGGQKVIKVMYFSPCHCGQDENHVDKVPKREKPRTELFMCFDVWWLLPLPVWRIAAAQGDQIN